MTNPTPPSTEPSANTRLADLLKSASTILQKQWSVNCQETIGCLYQDSGEIVIGTQSGWLKRFDRAGTLQSEYCALEGESIVVVAFCDNKFEGEPELILGSNRGSVCALGRNGNSLWYSNLAQWVGTLFLPDEKVSDGAEIIVGTHDGILYFLDGLGNVTDSLHTNYTVLTSLPYERGGTHENFYLGTRDGNILALNASGKEKWKKATDAWVYRLQQFHTSAGTEIILTGLQNGDLIAWNKEGARLWKRSLGYWISGLTVGDMNGDGINEIVAITRNGSLHILNENGETLWRWDLHKMVVEVVFLEAQADSASIVLVTEDTNLQCYSVSGLQEGLLQEIDGLVQDPSALSGLSELEIGTLGSLGFATGRVEEITYPQLMDSLENKVDLDQKTAATLLSQLRSSPMLLQWSQQVPAKIDTISWFRDADDSSGLVVGSVDGAISSWNATGELNWRFLTTPGNWIWSVRACDVNGDGHSEIIAGTKGRRLILLDRTGSWHGSFSLPQGVRSVFVAGLSPGSALEYLLGCEDAVLYALRPDGTLKWKYAVDGWIRCVIAADMDNDQSLEIICGSRGGTAYELDRAGNLRWKFDAGNWIRVVYACDLNGDGKLELVLGCDNGKIIVFNNAHQILWTYDMGFRIEAIRMLEIDGQRQLLIGSESQTLYSLTAEGNVAWMFNTLGWVRDIEVADLDQDGCAELILSTFSVIQSIQKSNYFLQVWKVLDQERRSLLTGAANQVMAGPALNS